MSLQLVCNKGYPSVVKRTDLFCSEMLFMIDTLMSGFPIKIGLKKSLALNIAKLLI